MRMKSKLRAVLEQLTHEFVDSVFVTLRSAVATEPLFAREVFRGARPASPPPPAPRAKRVESKGKPPAKRVPRAEGVRENRVPRAPKPPQSYARLEDGAPSSSAAETAVTDPELLLAAFEQRGDVPESGVQTRREPSLLESPRGPRGRDDVADAARGPALRDDEVVVRTARGGVVIKRRKNDDSAA